MRKRFKRSDLNRFLGHEAASNEVVHSHAYGRIARMHRSIPRPRRASSPRNMTVPNYRDSMVGSVAQYRDTASIAPRVPEKAEETHHKNIIGNRPQSNAADKNATDKAGAKRHHFIEPPKPRFNRFD